MKKIINYLASKNLTIYTMESATGGYLATNITNISGSSLVFKFGAVNYSNEYKIKMGVDEVIIKKYSVYSMETANEMSKKISEFTNSDYGVGITGKINEKDPFNNVGSNSLIYLSIYDKKFNCYYCKEIETIRTTRLENKKLVIEEYIKLFKDKIINK